MDYLQPQITFFEMPAIQLKGSDGNAITTLRVKDPKLAQIQLAGSLRQTLPKVGIHPKIKFIDMAVMNPENKTMYGTIDYGGKILNKYRIGASFDEVEFIVKSSDIICITANFTIVAGVVKDFINWVKLKNPDAIVIVGGTDATHRAEFYLKSGANFVVHGEGEVILHNLIEAILKQKDTEKISGISFIKGQQIFKKEKSESDTPSLEFIASPALDLLDFYSESSDGALIEGVKLPVALLETSRGCHLKCSSCASFRTKGRYRYVPPDRVINLLQHYKKHGISTVMLSDDSILSRLDSKGGRDAAIRLFKDMREMEFAWELFNGIEISRLIKKDRTIDQELIHALFYHEYKRDRFIGCFRAYIPLESLRGDTPKKISKFFSLRNSDNMLDFELEKKIIHEILKIKLPMIEFGFMVCTPDENWEYLELNRERALEIKRMVKEENSKVSREQRTQILFNFFTDTLLPGAPDYEDYKHRIVFSYEEYPELVNYATSIIDGDNFRYYEMFAAREKLFEAVNGKEIVNSFKASGKYTYRYP